jgi:hypothetical protein
MIRSCFNVASTLSLLLLCVIAAAWAWGLSTPRAFEFAYKGQVWQVVTDAGHLRIDNDPQRILESSPQLRRLTFEFRWRLARARAAMDEPRPQHEPGLYPVITLAMQAAEQYPVLSRWKQPAFRQTKANAWSTGFIVGMAGAAALPIIRLSAWGFVIARRRSRRRAGLCEWCGYELRGTLSGRCSECGRGFRPEEEVGITTVRGLMPIGSDMRGGDVGSARASPSPVAVRMTTARE